MHFVIIIDIGTLAMSQSCLVGMAQSALKQQVTADPVLSLKLSLVKMLMPCHYPWAARYNT